MTNTVHSVGTLSIANPKRTWSRLPCYPPAQSLRALRRLPPCDNPRCLTDKVQPCRLTDSDRGLRNPNRGFKLMKRPTRWGRVNRDAGVADGAMNGIFEKNRAKMHNSCG